MRIAEESIDSAQGHQNPHWRQNRTWIGDRGQQRVWPSGTGSC